MLQDESRKRARGVRAASDRLVAGYPRHREHGQNKSLSGKTQGIWKFCQNTGKAQGIWFAQVVNSLILTVKDISIFAMKISIFFKSLIYIGRLPSRFCETSAKITNWVTDPFRLFCNIL